MISFDNNININSNNNSNFVDITDKCGFNTHKKDTKKEFYLFRVPIDFDVNQLHKQTIQLNKDKNILKADESNNYICELDRNHKNSYTRPLIRDHITDFVTIGPTFKESFVISNECTISLHPNLPIDLNKLNVILPYKKKEQIKDLSIRHIPKGSFTTIDELNQRLKRNHFENFTHTSNKKINTDSNDKRDTGIDKHTIRLKKIKKEKKKKDKFNK